MTEPKATDERDLALVKLQEAHLALSEAKPEGVPAALAEAERSLKAAIEASEDAVAPASPLHERYARTICASRGANPDGALTIGYPDGSQRSFKTAWKGYLDLAGELLALHDAT